MHFKKNLILIFTCIIITGCALNKYGYTLGEWNNFTQQQRDDVKTEAEALTNKMMEDRRERDFVNKPVNTIFGSRSNVY